MVNESKFYTLFAMLILITSICSSMLGARIMDIGNIIYGVDILSGGIIPFCISFALLDIATNQYGYVKIKKIILYLLICKAVMAIFLITTLSIPANKSFHDEQSYQIVFSMMIRAFWASLLGTWVAYYLNCFIFSKLYISFNGKHLWLRCLIATTLGEIVFSLISTPILFWHTMSLPNIFNLIFHNYGFKIVFEIISLPMIYVTLYVLSKYEQPTKIQYKNFKPPHKTLNQEI